MFFMFIPISGRCPFWRAYFQMGWFNHQPVMVWLVSLTTFRGSLRSFRVWIPRSGGLTKAPWRHEGTLKTVLTRVEQGGETDRIWWGETSWKLTLQGTNISPKNGILKMIFLFPRWDMLIPWRVFLFFWTYSYWMCKEDCGCSFLLSLHMVTFCHMHHALHPKSFMLSTWIHFPYHPCLIYVPTLTTNINQM